MGDTPATPTDVPVRSGAPNTAVKSLANVALVVNIKITGCDSMVHKSVVQAVNRLTEFLRGTKADSWKYLV